MPALTGPTPEAFTEGTFDDRVDRHPAPSDLSGSRFGEIQMFPARSTILFLLASSMVLHLPGTASAQSLQQQAICAAQAKKAFEEDKAEQIAELLKGMSLTSNYENHYNAGMNRCFILEKWSSFRGSNTILSDAYEKRAYARYYYDYASGEYHCELIAPNERTGGCKSRGEFEAFVAKYMNDE